jgi:hypothetical protein
MYLTLEIYMRYFELFDEIQGRGLCESQRQASELFFDRSPNYLSQYREAEVTADDGVRLWRKLMERKDHEFAARVLLSVLDGGDQ